MLRVLVVDDDAAIRELLEDALHEAGYETILALDGQHALRLALVSHPDVVVLDLGLPIMSGPEFVANWREHSGDNCAPIVVMSGYPDVMAQAQRLGARAAFAKPFDIEALVAAVGES
jgi:two-component system KDP operon response regulator KdpE